MIENTEMQANLHPALISEDHQMVIDIARKQGAVGWKVNGAGGEGGSVTILSGPNRTAKRTMIRHIEKVETRFKNIPIYLSRFGLRVWESPASQSDH